MKNYNSRKIALSIIYDIEHTGKFSNKEIDKKFDEVDISAIDRRFITNLVYGVIENKIFLDYVVRKFSSTRIKKINKHILVILEMAVYQVMFLDKVPESAAVNEAVKLAKKIDYKYAKFANGILRNFVRSQNEIEFPKREDDEVLYLSVMYSHPEWMVTRWLERYGFDFTESMLKANNEKPSLNLRVNTLITSRETLLADLEAEGVLAHANELLEEAVTIEKLGDTKIENLETFKKGHFMVQDISSMFASIVLSPKSGDKVLDVCSAPGGKTTHMAMLMENNGEIHAHDIYPHKIELIQDNAKRLGIDIISASVKDATDVVDEDFEMYDKILIDAPCSGLGIIRRKPDIKLNRTEDDVLELSKLQKEIISVNGKYLKVGGEMVYSTCTIEPEENKNVVEAFLLDNKNFEIVNDFKVNSDVIKSEEGYINMYSNNGYTDGFFIVKLKKIDK